MCRMHTKVHVHTLAQTKHTHTHTSGYPYMGYESPVTLSIGASVGNNELLLGSS